MEEYKQDDVVYVLEIIFCSSFKATIEPKRIAGKGRWPHTYILKDIYSEDLDKGEYGDECFFPNMREALNKLEEIIKVYKKEV